MEAAVILVYSTTHALQIEKLLHAHGLECKLIPVPRHLSSDCGICVSISRNDTETVSGLLARAAIEVEGIYEV